MIIICSVWFANTKLQAFPFHVVKKLMYNSGLFCCKSCRQNPIFYSFLLKNFFSKKKIFHQKKSKNQNWPIFDFSLIGSSVFELETKTAKLRKQVELDYRWALLPAFLLCQPFIGVATYNQRTGRRQVETR